MLRVLLSGRVFSLGTYIMITISENIIPFIWFQTVIVNYHVFFVIH